MCAVVSQSVAGTAPTSSPHVEMTAIGDDYVKLLLNTIKQQDVEKLSLLDRIESCLKPEQEEAQRLRHEVVLKNEELGKLKRELSEVRLMLQEERERTTRLMYESVVLHAQAEDNRVTISKLMKQNNNATKSKDSKSPDSPVFTTGGHHSTSKLIGQQKISLRQAVATRQGASAGDGAASQFDSPEADAFPPSGSLLTALRDEVELLKSLLDTQRTMYENEWASRLHEERELERLRSEATASHLATIERLHKLHQTSLADLIRTRHEMRIEQRQLRGSVDRLQAALNDTVTTLNEERRQHSASLKEQRRLANESATVVTERLRKELQERRALSAAQEKQHTALLAQREAELKELRAERARDKRRLRQLEERYRLEREGVHNEVNLMRQELRAMEKRVYLSNSQYDLA
ncbi:unnamed protein product [Trypanosoma congolense IL3000]|uniref:WGS project CAEQ00000000 data, annotated contig 1794 n=1 Tax=Trypanosoma congolense (strain IL3000) TaxID=1068625 RepID=F9W8X6_TRYCI|nr:unnamed protein product [Trypanosoma congolense IL3000]